MQSSEMTEEQRKAHNERMKVYMRGYRLRKKLASGAVIALEKSIVEAPNDSGMGGCTSDAGSSIPGDSTQAA